MVRLNYNKLNVYIEDSSVPVRSFIHSKRTRFSAITCKFYNKSILRNSLVQVYFHDYLLMWDKSLFSLNQYYVLPPWDLRSVRL